VSGLFAQGGRHVSKNICKLIDYDNSSLT